MPAEHNEGDDDSDNYDDDNMKTTLLQIEFGNKDHAAHIVSQLEATMWPTVTL